SFDIAAHRTYEQDPRLGVIALSEISSRSLSQGVNDPGTAFEVLSALQRVMRIGLHAPAAGPVVHDRLHLRPLDPRDLVVDGFRPTARDVGTTVESSMRLQRELGWLIAEADELGRSDWAGPLRELARNAIDRARSVLTDETDLREVEQVHAAAVRGE